MDPAEGMYESMVENADIKVDMWTLVWVTEGYERPQNAKKVLVIRVDHSEEGDQPLEIPWPEGMTVTEALSLSYSSCTTSGLRFA